MKKHTYIAFALLLFSFICFFTSCDGKLNVTNPNEETSSDFWTSESDIAEGVIAVYNRLILDGSFQRTTPVLVDVRGDDVYSKSAWTIYPETGDFTVNADYDVLYWPWREFYQLIEKANLVFYHAPSITFSSSDYKNRLLGQVYFLRALAYYELALNYQKVPLVLSYPTSSSDYYPSTATEDEIWAAIISDLKKAQADLPTSYNSVTGDDKGQVGRATWGAATGLLGKVYMIRQKYDSAAIELKKVIDSGLYSLVSNYGDNFTMSNENNSESLFEVQFTSGGTTENWLGDPTSSWKQASCQDYCYGMTAFGAWGDFHPTKWIYNEFKKERCKDGTLDPRLYWTIVSYEPEYDNYTDGRSNEIFGTYPYKTDVIDSTNSTIYLAKYTYARISGHTSEGDGSRDNSFINYRFMRYSEILLLYAEALNELDGPTDDVYKYIQKVRDRVNLPDLETTYPNMTQSEMRTQLAHERALEFGAEDIRLFDLMRWGWFSDSNKLSELEEHDSEFDTYTTGHQYLPIPQTELDTNPNLSGNSAN